MNICTISIATINTFKSKTQKVFNIKGDNTKRPYVRAKINQFGRDFLYDTGASRTCIKLDTFNKMFPHGKPRMIKPDSAMQPLFDASGSDLNLIGVFDMTFEIFGKTFQHDVRVLEHVTEDIIGIDLIHKINLQYDPAQQEVFLNTRSQSSVLTLRSEEKLKALSKKIIKVNFNGTCDSESVSIATIFSEESKLIQGGPALIKYDNNNHAYIEVANCAPYDITLTRGSIIAIVENEDKEFVSEITGETIDDFISEVSEKQNKTKPIPNRVMSKEEIKIRAKLNIPEEWQYRYLDMLHKHAEVISMDKNDLGRATDFYHRIHLKDQAPVYRKQFTIPEAHTDFIEATLDEWLKLGVVRRSQSLYNSPIFCVPKKSGQGLRIVQDFRELNQHCHIDKYSMKEINDCIGDIGRAGSTIFSTLDLTSGFWQMPLAPEDANKTAFTIPGKGQFEWITSPMGLLGCPASFQRLMEKVMRDLKNVIIYIDDILTHTKTHEEQLQLLEQVFLRLKKHGMKINLDKCVFGNTEVSYLGFVLTPEGITPGKDKLKAIKEAKPPTDVKMVRSFIGLCNFFRTHIKNFATISAPLTRLTRIDSGYKGGQLPEEALKAFNTLKLQLVSNPVVAYPRQDRQYALIVDASTGSADTAGGLGAILTQVDSEGNFHVISYGSRQLIDQELNYSPYLLEMQAAVWGMEFYDNYLKGKKFVLYTDHKPLEKLGHLHTKTLNRLQLAMMEYDFAIQYKKGILMPADYLSRHVISALGQSAASIDPFSPDLTSLQQKDPDLIKMDHFRRFGKWPLNTSKTEINKMLPFVNSLVTENKTVWVRLIDEDYPRTALFLPQVFRKRAICEAHGSILSGHDGLRKTYIRITSSYFWPGIKPDIQKHLDSCLQCQQRKKSTAKPLPLQTLPTVDQPNFRIHIDLFGPLKTSENKNKYILCITDAFTKYAEVIAIPDKTAETVAAALFDKWFCRMGTPVQIHSDNGKEFVNKLSKELFTLLDIKHTTTTPAHPQCNAQVETFNKTVAKYFASFVDETTLDWEIYVPALMFAYNTSYHSTIATTPFELLYGMRPRTPAFPSGDIQRKFYGETFATERLQTLQKARQLARQHIDTNQAKYKEQHDKKSRPHDFSIGQRVWYTQTDFLKKNKKLAPKYLGPATIIEINESVVKIQLDNNKLKKLNVKRIKHFVATDESENEEEDSGVGTDNSDSEDAQPELIKFETSRPRTRAWSKLIKTDAVSTAIEEEIWYKLNNIAFKLYQSHSDLNQLTAQEQAFWKSFKLADIYEWLTGDPEVAPDYQEYVTVYANQQRAQQAQPAQPAAPGPAFPAPPPAPPAPIPGPPPKKPGRPAGSKNKPKNPFTRVAHYASKRYTRSSSGSQINPPTINTARPTST